MAKTALLLMDVQRAIVSRFDSDPDYLPRLRQAVDHARAGDMLVGYVVVGFRPGHPEVNPANAIFGRMIGTDAFTPADPGAEIHPDIAPAPGDLVFTKKRVSAFAGSDLDQVLRSSDVDSLVLTGIATSGVVLSTVRQAFDLDYRLTVLSDGCLDSDPEVHRVLTTAVFPRQADVLTVADWTS
ncbi:cysteine hydrolase family protein [Kutzneria sp. CA-103260]|uniref:cysteine hydrolase family protein n=1 Tax=Kutzneria sp. CA-103260 TaxID=2802641 RepID=UPI001BADB50C|nr:isochorismatase family cysteine hydrolase [Kutzneria sp. CA-103260]QUQ66717.1 hydrolase [Kutzneria sp. CA-103260]